jgi:hypothetical protein
MFNKPGITRLLIIVLLLAACSSPATSPVARTTPVSSTATPVLPTATSVATATQAATATLVARSPATQGKKVPTSLAEVPRITPQELKSLLEGARYVIIVDTRSRDEFEESHIPGARQMLLSEVETRVRELPVGPKIVFYCA